MSITKGVLAEPTRPENLDEEACWLAGEGAGSWFVINGAIENNYTIKRYSPEGIMECQGDFMTDSEFDLKKEFHITYPSHCQVVTLIQFKRLIVLYRK